LPEWMPRPLTLEFESLRRDLLVDGCSLCEGGTHTPEDVRAWLAAYRAAIKPVKGYRSIPAFPIEHAYELRDLAYIQDIEALGPERGLPAYLGSDRKSTRLNSS